MAIFPKATRTSFARLLRKRGYALPRNRELMFSNVGHSFFLMWDMLVVDQDTVRLTMAEVIGLGMVRVTRGGPRKQKNPPPTQDSADREPNNKDMIPHPGEKDKGGT